jgi:UDPglucose 6-dehydrogenase
MSRISIIGSGIVGTVIGKGFLELGHFVIFHDINKSRVEQLKKEGYDATDDISYAISNSEVSFICVPTNSKNGKIDLSHMLSAIQSIGEVLTNKQDRHIIAIKSTVVPTTTEKFIIPKLEEISGKKVGTDIFVCTNPEFLTEIAHTWSNNTSDQRGFYDGVVVIGEPYPNSIGGDVIMELFEPVDKPKFRVDMKTAEAIKYFGNIFLLTKISYWNEAMQICQKLDIDSKQIADILALDTRIGRYGTIHGKAAGGRCLPKDSEAFLHFITNDLGFDSKIVKAAKEINDFMAKNYGIRE